MAMGQVAGAAAALAARRNASPLDLPIDELRGALASSGAIVPDMGIAEKTTKDCGRNGPVRIFTSNKKGTSK
jgi:hypothetical protein